MLIQQRQKFKVFAVVQHWLRLWEKRATLLESNATLFTKISWYVAEKTSFENTIIIPPVSLADKTKGLWISAIGDRPM